MKRDFAYPSGTGDHGRVAAVGYGVGNRSVDARTGLPNPRTQSGWIRSPQPMPVRIVFDQETRPLRFGSQANVMVYSSNNVIMNAIGYIRMRLVALLTYCPVRPVPDLTAGSTGPTRAPAAPLFASPSG